MRQKIDMLNGDIRGTLIQLSLPIIMSNFIQTALGIVDMIWVGRLGSEAVSAVGTASFFINLATALSTIITVGTGVRVAQSIGNDEHKKARIYNKNSIVMSVVVSVLFSLILGVFAQQLIAFFDLNNPAIELMSKDFLIASLMGMPFLFLITTYTTVFTSYGDTRPTFVANSIGLIVNIILDPMMIFGFAFIPAMGIVGAAWATNISRLITFGLLVIASNDDIKASFKETFDIGKVREVFRMSFPVTAQRILFTFISMVMAKIIVQYGAQAIAVQKIGIQIESISYVTIGGIQGAIAAFIGQNYGAGLFQRIKESYTKALNLVIVFGLIVSLVFLIFPKPIFAIFINESSVIDDGVGYMQAIAFSQAFMCIELLTVGAFNGIGKTHVPPLVSTVLTAARIPLAILFSQYMGLIGVWWSISITSVAKGIVLMIWFKFSLRGIEPPLTEAIQ